MSVQFDEDNFGVTQRPYIAQQTQPLAPDQKTGSKMGDWMVRSGLAKDAASANVIMTLLALVVFAISIYFFFFGFSTPQFSGPQRPDSPLPPGLEI